MTSSPGRPAPDTRALVVFHGAGAAWFARLLAPGFRHCFVCIPDTRSNIWIRFDGQAGIPDLRAEAPLSFDLAKYYRDAGYVTIECRYPAPARPMSPVMLATCVGAVKRLLGIRAPLVLTPRQLYRYLAQ